MAEQADAIPFVAPVLDVERLPVDRAEGAEAADVEKGNARFLLHGRRGLGGSGGAGGRGGGGGGGGCGARDGALPAPGPARAGRKRRRRGARRRRRPERGGSCLSSRDPSR